MATILKNARIEPYRASSRAVSTSSWLTSHRSFNFPDYYSPSYQHFGPIRILNEDVVAPASGFPMHAHRDAEIFSYILSGELTHRDSTVGKADGNGGGAEGEGGGGGGGGQVMADKKLFYRMHRGDVQFSSAGRGVWHSENNESAVEAVRFLQIWVLPWKEALRPVYHTQTFAEEEKRKGFVMIISPLKEGPDASSSSSAAVGGAGRERSSDGREEEAVMSGTIPIHADFVFGAGIVPAGETFLWKVAGGRGVVSHGKDRQVYVYLPMMKGGKARVRLNGSDDAILEEGDGAFVRGVDEGDELVFESVGEEEAEVVVLDANPN